MRQHGDGVQNLVLWSKDGQELGRGAFDIQGEVKAGQIFGSRLVVASAEEVAEFDSTTLQRGRSRSITAAATRTTLYKPGPSGVWVISDKAVSYFDLDGRPPVVKVRPLTAVDKPPCTGNWAGLEQPCSKGLQPERTEAVTSETGDIVVVETFEELYPYTGGSVDNVWPSTATVLDTSGTIITQKPLSWVKTRWEWFWFKEGSSHGPLGWPQLGGVVRTRYETGGASLGRPILSRKREFLFLSRGSDELYLTSVDRHFNSRWRRTLGATSLSVVSPLWASPILLHDNVCHQFATINAQGSGEQQQTIEISDLARELWKNDFKRPRFVIGQSTEGDWLLIAY